MTWALPDRRAATFAACLEGGAVAAELDDGTAALVAFAQALSSIQTPLMRPDFAADLRSRLLAAAPTFLVSTNQAPAATIGPRQSSRGTPRGRLTVAAATALVLGTGVGVGYASQSALPGDPLYPVLKTLERLQVATAGSLADQGREQLSQASTRLSEVAALVDQSAGDPAAAPLLSSTLQDFSEQSRSGASSLITAYTDEGDLQAIVDLRAFTAESVGSLAELSRTVPGDVFADVSSAAQLMTDLDSQAMSACPTCSDLGGLELPPGLVGDQLPGPDGPTQVGPPATTTTPDTQGPSTGTSSTAPTSGAGVTSGSSPTSAGPAPTMTDGAPAGGGAPSDGGATTPEQTHAATSGVDPTTDSGPPPVTSSAPPTLETTPVDPPSTVTTPTPATLPTTEITDTTMPSSVPIAATEATSDSGQLVTPTLP